MEASESARQITEPIDESSETLFRSRRRCCFSFPCFDRNQSPSASPAVGVTWWQRIRTAEIGGSGNSVWSRGVGAVMKIREWSELVAGPRWKTFIRRFNRNRSGGKHANFQYDALSYAMNFDEGPGHSGDFTSEEGDDGYYYASRNFSSRYAKGSMDLGKDGPTFV
ncbi:hypothetical protein C2S53_009251 [Perilla frutescens var. hirtella]|uniref:Uncharacterized protein n=1 Tax=Perilla frutescens var. hirtella TaxID=608512 RepID=A0AAD4IQH9_PERFH|nr:hypothetical protein C2S53_009251 [Perilla frutescens var. hirtella]